MGLDVGGVEGGFAGCCARLGLAARRPRWDPLGMRQAGLGAPGGWSRPTRSSVALGVG